MARRYIASQSQYSERTGDPCGIAPITISVHFFAHNDSSLYNLVSIENTTGLYDWISLHANGGATGDPIVALISSGGSVTSAQTSNGFRAGQWNHAGLLVQPFGTLLGDRYAFCNGVAGTKVSATQNYMRSPVSVRLGSHMNYGYSTVVLYDVAIYAGALDFTDMTRLANRVPAKDIRRDILAFNAFAPGSRSKHDVDQSRLRSPITSYNSVGFWSDPPPIKRRLFRVASLAAASSFTAAITGTMGAMTAALSASHTKPTYTASIAATIAPMTAAVSASHAPPTSTAAITASMGAMTAALSATFTKPTYTASINGTFAPMTATVSAQFTKPTYTASIAATMAPMVASVSATSAGPTFTAAIGATMAPMTASLAATFSKPVYTAAIAATLAPMSASVSATLISPTYTAAITATMGAMTASLSAAFSEVFFVSPVSHLSEAIARRLRTEASTGILESGSNARRLRSEAVAAYVATEAVARRLRTSNVN